MSDLNCIPVMDDPLSRGWTQPRDIRQVLMDDKHVILTAAQRRGLYEYSTSLPSGVYPGKCWLRLEPRRALLVWYGEETPDHKCPILFREVLDV